MTIAKVKQMFYFSEMNVIIKSGQRAPPELRRIPVEIKREEYATGSAWLADGHRVTMRVSFARVVRVEGCVGEDGSPVYEITPSTLMQVRRSKTGKV